MERIPLNATDVQVTQAIASILHNPNGPFIALSPDRLINFRVHLFRDQRKNRPHYGKGALTIPTPAVGELLLRNWPNIEVRGAFISLSRSRRAPRQDVLEEIRRIPYIDLTELRIREERLGKLTGNVSVSLLQFGWECRDGVWSAEWESRGSWSLSMDDDNRRIILRLSAVGSIKTKIVHLRYSHIKWIGRDLHSSPRIMFLSLDFPPMFGTQDALVFDSSHTEVLAFFGLPDVIALDAITNKIHQTSFLDEEHEHVAPYTSTSLVLHCRSSEDAALFVKFCGIIGKGIENQQCTIEQRGLFSTQHMEMMHEWLQNLPRSVAFGVDAILRSTIADPQELLSIQPIINGLIGGTRKDNEYVAEILKQLTIRLKNWDWREGEDESEESAQDQSATVKPPRLQTVKEILEHIIESTRKKDIPAPSQRAPGVFDCWHVQVTPTAVLIEGMWKSGIMTLFGSLNCQRAIS
jgi:RNA-dependent RNA polymerase